MTTAATRKSRPRSPGAQSKHNAAPCTRCGEVHKGCTGHTKNGKRAGRPCGKPPVSGADCCDTHLNGGVRAEQAVKRFEFAQSEGKIAELLREADIPNQHPLDGLLEVVRHAGGMMRMLHVMVSGLDDEPGLEWYKDAEGIEHIHWNNNSLYGVDHNSDQAPHVLVLLYEKWASIYGRACKMALDANIDERMIRNQEATSATLFQAIGKALTAAELTPAQQQVFRLELASALREIAEPPAMHRAPQLGAGR